MRRWHPTAALGLVAGLGALLAPQWVAQAQGPAPHPVLPVPEPVTAPALIPTEVAQSEHLHLEAGLDHPSVLAGRSQERLLVITVRADQVDGGERAPVNVAVVMDRSGSMRQQARMDYAQSAAEDLVDALHDDDRFALVSFSSEAHLVVPSTQVHDPAGLHRSIRGVRPAGSTNLHAGMRMGQDQVRAYATPQSVDRVIVLSDGYANVGVQAPSELARAAGSWADEGVAVSTIGLGLDYNEDLLASMADASGGTYRFVNDAESLQAAFEAELQRMNSVAARGVGLDINLEDAELIDVLGYDAQRTDTGVRVFLGDVYGGETRRVVLRVRVNGGTDGERLTASTVRLSEGPLQVAEVDVSAISTTDTGEVERSANRELAIVGNEAAAADLAQKAAAAYAAGDIQTNQALMSSSQLIAGEAASRYDAPTLRKQEAALKSQQDAYTSYDFESEEGSYNIKRSKEDNRGYLR